MAKRSTCSSIGGGHNGLVAAAYLAKAGKDVTLLERSDVVGGILREQRDRARVHGAGHRAHGRPAAAVRDQGPEARRRSGWS